MRKFPPSLAALLIGLLGIGFTVAGCSSDDSSTQEDQPAATAGGNAEPGNGSDRAAGGYKKGSSDQAAAGAYVDYSSELLESTPGEKLLFFHAPWCSQCQALDADIAANGVPDGVTIFKVDYDSNQDLRQEYGVTIQTTVVKVDDDGEKVDSYVAYEEPTLDNVVAALLQ